MNGDGNDDEGGEVERRLESEDRPVDDVAIGRTRKRRDPRERAPSMSKTSLARR